MKFFTSAILAATILSGSAMALEWSTYVTVAGIVQGGVLTTVWYSLSCTLGHVPPTVFKIPGKAQCAVAISTSIAFFLKEEVKSVEPDLYNFIAGEPATFALQEVIELVKEKIPEARNDSDEKIALFLLDLSHYEIQQ